MNTGTNLSVFISYVGYGTMELMNLAFIDGQNLYMGTKSNIEPWEIDLFRFRHYLTRKYQVEKAYYFLGYIIDENQELYEMIQSAGFILVFREHNRAMVGKKKGNVDADIVFNVMKRIIRGEDFEKVVLVSGDGDYKMLVDFLIEEDRFKKILFPNQKFASSLYKSIGGEYYDSLSATSVRTKIEQKEKGSLGS